MNTDQMAHEYAIAIIRSGFLSFKESELIAQEAWELADAMQAEWEKRSYEPAIANLISIPEAILEAERQNFDEFEVDWDQAPDWAVAWAIDRLGSRWWLETPRKGVDIWVPVSTSWKVIHTKAPNFSYTGDWRNSLRKRPDVEVNPHG